MKKINKYCILSKNELAGIFGSRPHIETWHSDCVKPAMLARKSETIIRVHREKWQDKKTQYNIKLEVVKNINNEYLVGINNKDTKETISLDVLSKNGSVKLSNYKLENWECLSPFLRKYIFYPDIKHPDGKLSIELNNYALEWIFKAIEPVEPDYIDIYVIDFGPKGYTDFARSVGSFDQTNILNKLPNV